MSLTAKEVYLPGDALKAFDKDFRDWGKYRNLIQHCIRQESVDSILDVGGRTGRFADKLLGLYPDAEICVLNYPGSVVC